MTLHSLPQNYDFGCGPYVLPDRLHENQVQEIETIINRSFFPVNSFDNKSSPRISVVIQAFRLFTKALNHQDKTNVLENNFYNSLCLLLPQLEHGLRMIYVAINELDHKFGCAVSKIHYTTLDHFLSETLENEVLSQPRKNELPQEVGYHVVECLLDLFTHVAGPRIRDRMSHGECSSDIQTSVNRLIADRVFGIFLYLCIKYNTESQVSLSTQGIAAHVTHYFENYTSCFHPKVVVYKQHLFNSLTQWISLESLVLQPQPSDEVVKQIDQLDEEKKWIYQYKNDYEAEENNLQQLIHEIYSNMTHPSFSIQNYDPVVMNTFNEKKIEVSKYSHTHIKRYFSTLFRPQTELSKIITITSIVGIVSMISGMVVEKLQTGRKDVIEDKAGRRQQDSLYKLLACLG